MKPEDLELLRTFANVTDIYLTSGDLFQVQKALRELLKEYVNTTNSF